MGSLSIWQWLVILFSALVLMVPACLIARKAGYHWAYGVLYGVPVIGIIVLWVFACSKWPAIRKAD